MTDRLDGTVHFVMTGGGIDSDYDGDVDSIVPRENSVIPQYIARVKLDRPLQFTQVCMKDSRRLTEQDRQTIAEVIDNSDAQGFIVTHGNYTLPETARYLETRLGPSEKVVILTGGTPLEGVTMSTSAFNLGFAYAQLGVLRPGVCVCLNGRVFTPAGLSKLLDEGRFTSIFSALPSTNV